MTAERESLWQFHRRWLRTQWFRHYDPCVLCWRRSRRGFLLCTRCYDREWCRDLGVRS